MFTVDDDTRSNKCTRQKPKNTLKTKRDLLFFFLYLRKLKKKKLINTRHAVIY